ncbi:hypothetical protein BO70DRAFT_97925 [Aspergillus heteromorphus CBS 117.55]|uniref:Secreted protein n=1 Tax=Aspergillus heteromorphus CBS 117.55 TaxID=1448321 RepID=A0A317VNG8_9EURO|nr:uncharacterized protein BO70DRAFT_97925 [Aspergillus heteromorphus CBS 117.55]PWY75475.1 hypothetical protein BO70DRAFT_97925 [Aspergillus heteromorphus CBS 117.55]
MRSVCIGMPSLCLLFIRMWHTAFRPLCFRARICRVCCTCVVCYSGVPEVRMEGFDRVESRGSSGSLDGRVLSTHKETAESDMKNLLI